MAYNNQKGTQHTGDIQFEGDPNDTQIDFENDFVAIKTNNQQRFIVSGSAITSSVNIVPSVTLTNDLGSVDLEWSRLYVEEVIGDIEGARDKHQQWLLQQRTTPPKCLLLVLLAPTQHKALLFKLLLLAQFKI
jgi:hypothetical protein